MQIRFISGLTAEEEDEFAPALLRSVATLLDRFPLAYTLRIETLGNQVYQHSQPARATEGGVAPLAQTPVAGSGPSARHRT